MCIIYTGDLSVYHLSLTIYQFVISPSIIYLVSISVVLVSHLSLSLCVCPSMLSVSSVPIIYLLCISVASVSHLCISLSLSILFVISVSFISLVSVSLVSLSLCPPVYTLFPLSTHHPLAVSAISLTCLSLCTSTYASFYLYISVSMTSLSFSPPTPSAVEPDRCSHLLPPPSRKAAGTLCLI